MKFDNEGKYLGLGDKAGRIIIFKSIDSKKKEEKYAYHTEVLLNFYLSLSRILVNSIP